MGVISSLSQKVQNRINAYRTTPNWVRERWLFGLKRALQPQINLPIWVTTNRGAKVFLGNDPIDQIILCDVSVEMEERYFPKGLALGSGDVVLDVGGHHGLYAMELAARFPGIKILTIEPDPDGIASIKKHIGKNRMSANVTVVPYAIGSEETEGFLADNHDGSWGKTLESVELKDTIKVPVQTLQLILEGHGKDVRFVKSNCEGGEFDLIPQLIELNIKPEFIVLMIHPERGNADVLVRSLEDYGYRSEIVWDSPINPCWHFTLRRQDQ